MPQKRSGRQYARGTQQRKRRVRFHLISIVGIINIYQLRDGRLIVEVERIHIRYDCLEDRGLMRDA